MDGRSLPARRYRDNQATETGWPCSTDFTNSFRRLGGSLAHVLELVAGEAWRRRPHGFFSNIRMTSSGISRGGAVHQTNCRRARFLAMATDADAEVNAEAREQSSTIKFLG